MVITSTKKYNSDDIDELKKRLWLKVLLSRGHIAENIKIMEVY